MVRARITQASLTVMIYRSKNRGLFETGDYINPSEIVTIENYKGMRAFYLSDVFANYPATLLEKVG